MAAYLCVAYDVENNKKHKSESTEAIVLFKKTNKQKTHQLVQKNVNKHKTEEDK